jgi:hypothetical protein
MIYAFRLFFSLVFLSGILYSCGGQTDGKLPTDLINNPMSASDQKSENTLPEITFEKTTHDYGRLIQGEKVSYSFKYTNTGTADLLISNVTAGCGCTVPRFTRDPIKPGENGTINVIFDSHGRRGFQNKSVTVISNTIPNTTALNVKAIIVVPEQD